MVGITEAEYTILESGVGRRWWLFVRWGPAWHILKIQKLLLFATLPPLPATSAATGTGSCALPCDRSCTMQPDTAARCGIWIHPDGLTCGSSHTSGWWESRAWQNLWTCIPFSSCFSWQSLWDTFVIWEGCDNTLLAKGSLLPMSFYHTPSSTYTILITIRQMLLQIHYSYWKVMAALY